MVGHLVLWAFRWPHQATGEFILFLAKFFCYISFILFKTFDDGLYLFDFIKKPRLT